jgi:hypothetical protein
VQELQVKEITEAMDILEAHKVILMAGAEALVLLVLRLMLRLVAKVAME